MHTEVTAVKVQWNHTPGNVDSFFFISCKKQQRKIYQKNNMHLCKYTLPARSQLRWPALMPKYWLFYVNSQSLGWSYNTDWILVRKRCARHYWSKNPEYKCSINNTRTNSRIKLMNLSFQFESVRKIIVTFYFYFNLLDWNTDIFITKFQELALKTFNKWNFSSKNQYQHEGISTSYVRCPLG